MISCWPFSASPQPWEARAFHPALQMRRLRPRWVRELATVTNWVGLESLSPARQSLGVLACFLHAARCLHVSCFSAVMTTLKCRLYYSHCLDGKTEAHRWLGCAQGPVALTVGLGSELRAP